MILRRRAALHATSLFAVLSMTAIPASAQEVPDLGKLAGLVRWSGVFVSLFVVVGALVLIRVISNVAGGLGRRFANRRPTIQKVESVARFVVYMTMLAVVTAFSIRLDSTAVALIGGALAFAVGFAMRDLVAAFIAGITIMFDRPFQVGDRVAFAGQYGDILTIGLRSVRMNTLDHNIVTIPNNKVLTDVTASGNYGALEMQTPFIFYIGVDQDVVAATEIIREACLTSPFVFLEQPVPIEMDQVIVADYVAVQLKARPYVFDCKHEKAFQTDVHLRVSKAFRERHILPRAILHRTREPADSPDRAAR